MSRTLTTPPAVPVRAARLICGHVHDSWHTKGQQYNVGVDVNQFTPVSFETIAAWYSQKG